MYFSVIRSKAPLCSTVNWPIEIYQKRQTVMSLAAEKVEHFEKFFFNATSSHCNMIINKLSFEIFCKNKPLKGTYHAQIYVFELTWSSIFASLTQFSVILFTLGWFFFNKITLISISWILLRHRGITKLSTFFGAVLHLKCVLHSTIDLLTCR